MCCVTLCLPRLTPAQRYPKSYNNSAGVYDCRHPLWGGQGACTQSASRGAAAYCECDSGYASTDALGQASCVPKLALVTGYTLVAFVGAVATVYL